MMKFKGRHHTRPFSDSEEREWINLTSLGNLSLDSGP
jgi:hypothetical protein